MLEVDASLRMFKCVNSCTNGFSDYLSQGICFPNCDGEKEYLVEGKCVSVKESGYAYHDNLGECIERGDIALWTVSGDK